MKNINLGFILSKKYPRFLNKHSAFIKHMVISLLDKILGIEKLNALLSKISNGRAQDVIDQIFDELNINIAITTKDKEKIPAEGRLICTANHPVGALDGLAIVKTISKIRTDVKVVVNDILTEIEEFKDIFIPVSIFDKKSCKNSSLEIINHLNNEGVVVFFPASEVSRFNYFGISDCKWNKGAAYFSKKTGSPILPVFVRSRLSIGFYILSFFYKPISMLLLLRENLRKAGSTIALTVGNYIPSKNISSLKTYSATKLLRKHTYNIGRGGRGLFKTEKTIMHPVNRSILIKELNNLNPLGEVSDSKLIFVTDYDTSPNIVKETCRLRELTFRKVGEGTGKHIDFDKYDLYYKHIILWDPNDLEIAGSYRFTECNDLVKEKGIGALYTASLFTFNELFAKCFPYGVEFGRSFVNPKYWGTSALNYLWQGIGSYLLKNQNIRYLFGAASISDWYPETCKEHLIYYYRRWFGTQQPFLKAKNPYKISNEKEEELRKIYSNDQRNDFIILKQILKEHGFSVPTLFKQYSELCDNGGVKFLDFSIDESFSNCVDGFVVVDTHKIKESKKKIYMQQPAAESTNIKSALISVN